MGIFGIIYRKKRHVITDVSREMQFSVVYTFSVVGILIMSFVIVAGYVPTITSLDIGLFSSTMDVTGFSIKLVFRLTILSAIALGFSSMLQVWECAERELVDGLVQIAKSAKEVEEATAVLAGKSSK
ncbi:MAG: hypothetical protein QGG26_08675 [Candidatus Undinarchaeales archaeon]|jgi:hypothetical protein|nr:hypothetical protein [Candidatus Undinarchaeales archaeon]